ncbi:hypothetical protein FRB94_006664 [Tulasnella sp. JGI-2019a]|nr:hypothetical protein FRB93_006437 [Tulasnella sp. JGI-2019a]KAG8998774.1 hypothetical protein FRB94_006664 [Tulasnella sp. JGI-2019a]KAG9029003.1 hypothetical protein FRB95_005823 [Tulasnella sp. JGI-2019a]
MYAPSLSQIARILGSSPRLETFTFDYLEIKETEDEPMYTEKIHLPNLTTMNTFQSDRHTLDYLFSLIQFPLLSCTAVELESSTASHMTHVTKPFHYSSSPFIEQVARFPGTGDWVNIKFYEKAVSLMIGRGNMPTDFYRPPQAHFHLVLAPANRGGSFKDTIRQLAELTTKALPALPVHLDLKRSVHPDFQVELFGLFPATTRINPTRTNFDSRLILRYLSCQQHSNPFTGEEEWPCPRLTRLDLPAVSVRQVNAARECVKARWVKWNAPAEEPVSGPQIVEKPAGSVQVMMSVMEI